MIVKMKSVSVLGLSSHSNNILESLRNCGVVHLKNIKVPESNELEIIKERIAKTEAVLRLVSKYENNNKESTNSQDIDKLIDDTFVFGEELRIANEQLSQLKRESSKIEYLGEFTPKDIENLRNNGIVIRLYELKPDEQMPVDVAYTVIHKSKEKNTVAVISKGDNNLPFNEIPIPERSIAQIDKEIKKVSENIKKISESIKNSAKQSNAIKLRQQSLLEEKEFEVALAGMGEKEEIIYLKGYCPISDVGNLKTEAEKNSWGLIIDDPKGEEEPPTLIKNHKWIQIVNPVFKIMGAVPGYKEFDINLWFLLFFSAFFAIIVGDAGYGAIYLAITLFAQIKFGSKVKDKAPFYLMYMLGGTTVLWGAITGVWFGSEAISQIAPFSSFIIPSLNAFKEASQSTVMQLCFWFAIIQLTIAHLMAASRVYNSLLVLAEIGWLSLMWGLFFLVNFLVLEIPTPAITSKLIGAGAILIILFSNAKGSLKNAITESLSSLLPTVLGFVSAFADTMSYIRLFAVGLAGLAVSMSAIEMAMGLGFDSIGSSIGTILILVFGHALNIVLGLMSVMVHGLRLNMLEFSGHVGNTWSGYEYKPFKK